MIAKEYSNNSLTEHSLGYAGLSIFSNCANSEVSDNFQSNYSQIPLDNEDITPGDDASYSNYDKRDSKVTPRNINNYKNVYSNDYSSTLKAPIDGSNTTHIIDYNNNNPKNSSSDFTESPVDIDKFRSIVTGKLIWLESHEVCGLIPVPQISNSATQMPVKSYIVFTPYSLDVLQDLTEVFGQLPNGQRPFFIIHSYSFDSMYFQAKLCNKKFDYKSISTNYIENDIDSYVFYLSHLDIVDNTSSIEKIRVNYSLIKDVKYVKNSKPAPKQKPKEVAVRDKKSQNSIQQPISRWVYEEANLDLETDVLWNVPRALVREVKLVMGITEKTNILRADVSTANHRYNSMLNQTYTIERVQSPGYSNDGESQSKINPSDIRDSDRGMIVKVRFESDYFGYYDEDIIRIFDDSQLSNALDLMTKMTSDQAPNISIINLAQYCPNIFWNLAFKGNVEDRLAILSPQIYNQCSKRRRRGATNSDDQKNVSKVINRLKYLHYDITIENNFEIMQNIYRLDAEAKIANLKKLESTANAIRHKPLLTLDDQEIVDAVIDKSGAMKLSISSLNEHQRRVVYAECLARNYFPPVYLIHSFGKGRGVEAAYDIQKDDFVMEYKGELVTEKEAKERDKKYNQKSCFGSFIFYFKHDGKHYSIDATNEYIQYGAARLINHSRINPNLAPKTLYVGNIPRLFFIAKRVIKKGEELLVDYGERDPEIIKDNPWLDNT